MNFGEKVKFLAKEKGTNPAKVLRELGIGHSAVSDWIKKGSNPTGKNFVKIAKYFNVSSDYLLGLTDDPTPP